VKKIIEEESKLKIKFTFWGLYSPSIKGNSEKLVWQLHNSNLQSKKTFQRYVFVETLCCCRISSCQWKQAKEKLSTRQGSHIETLKAEQTFHFGIEQAGL
jgi:hypothetical protein